MDFSGASRFPIGRVHNTNPKGASHKIERAHARFEGSKGASPRSMTGGAFRLCVSTAATFGLTENERGKVKLTTLGRRIADPTQLAAARVDAFLPVRARLER